MNGPRSLDHEFHDAEDGRAHTSVQARTGTKLPRARVRAMLGEHARRRAENLDCAQAALVEHLASPAADPTIEAEELDRRGIAIARNHGRSAARRIGGAGGESSLGCDERTEHRPDPKAAPTFGVARAG